MIRWEVVSDGSKRILGITFSVFVTSVVRAVRMREHYWRIAPRDRRLRSVQSALDFVVGLGFLAATLVVLVLSWDESPETPLRLWISVSTLQHLLHVSYLCIQYNRERWPRLSQRRYIPHSYSNLAPFILYCLNYHIHLPNKHINCIHL